MRQDHFERRYREEWNALRQWLDARAQARKPAPASESDQLFDDTEFPRRYRRVCQQLALAKRRGFSPRLTQELDALVHHGHAVMYRVPAPRLNAITRFFTVRFPRLVRREWRFVLASAVLFFGPLLTMVAVLQFRPELVYSVMSPEQVMQMESMYNPSAEHQKLGRESGDDLMMFGFYIMNNISIGFRTLASGFLFCIPAIFILGFNGISIGAAAGHLTAIGYGDPFWRFVAGHSAPELIAIVLAGAAGLKLGFALIAPGPRTRARALVETGRDVAQFALVVFALLVVAAFIEAYWSSIVSVPRAIKFAVGISGWLLIVLWLWRGGRGQHDAT